MNKKAYLIGHVYTKTKKVVYAHYSSDQSPIVNLRTTVTIVLAEVEDIDYDTAKRKLQDIIETNIHYEWLLPIIEREYE